MPDTPQPNVLSEKQLESIRRAGEMLDSQPVPTEGRKFAVTCPECGHTQVLGGA